MKKLMSKATIFVASIGLVAVSAHAGPPRDSGRDVITEAGDLCAAPPAFDSGSGSDEEIFSLACDLVFKTNGAQVEGKACAEDYSDTNGFVTYTGRNCVKNEDAQLRKASSVVLSMDSVIERDKTQQVYTAAKYACEYASKAAALAAPGVDKLDLQGTTLIGDARDIADALGYPCE